MTAPDMTSRVILSPADLSVDPRRLQRCVELIASVVRYPQRVLLEVTDDVKGIVHAHALDPQAVASLDPERALGRSPVAAIPQLMGITELAIDVGAFALPGEGAERLVLGEALRIALRERRESLWLIREVPAEADTAAAVYRGWADAAVDEFRIWAAVQRRLPAPAPLEDAELDATARRFVSVVRRATVHYQLTFDSTRMIAALDSAFGDLVLFSARVAAESGASPPLAAGADAVFGEPWRAVISTLGEIAPADEITPRPQLESAADAVAGGLRGWLSHIGFELDDPADGVFAFHVHNLEAWRVGDEG